MCFVPGDSVQSRLLRFRSAHTNLPSHSTHVTQVTCVKADVFFDRKPGSETPRTRMFAQMPRQSASPLRPFGSAQTTSGHPRGLSGGRRAPASLEDQLCRRLDYSCPAHLISLAPPFPCSQSCSASSVIATFPWRTGISSRKAHVDQLRVTRLQLKPPE